MRGEGRGISRTRDLEEPISRIESTSVGFIDSRDAFLMTRTTKADRSNEVGVGRPLIVSLFLCARAFQRTVVIGSETYSRDNAQPRATHEFHSAIHRLD